MEQMESPRWWRPLVVPAIVVAILLAIAWALFAHFGRSKPDASGSILRQVVYPVQVNAADSQAAQAADNGMAGKVPEQDETILLVQARVTNITNRPLTIFDANANVKLDGNDNVSPAALPEDVDRLLQRFPELDNVRIPPLQRHQVIAPGQSVEGLIAFSYPWSQQQWNRHKAANIVISFENGRPVTLPLQ
ncbi:MAG: hypothetical protein WA708_05285 [Acidobacteriaceae bacterium]